MSRHHTMSEKVEQYIAYRHDMGYATRGHSWYLRHFGAFADRVLHRGPLTVALALRWSRLPGDQNPHYCASRLKMVRCLAKYLAITDPRTEIPPIDLIGPTRQRKPPYIYSGPEISALIAAARQLQPHGSLRPWNYATLIGLFASTGLRLSEATRLARSDFDDRQGVLTIRETKFHKSRFVPLHPSVTKNLRRYAQKRDELVPLVLSDRFFISDRGTALSNITVQGIFRKLCERERVVRKGPGNQPRLHDLRHTFACRRVQEWYETGVDVNHAIVALAVYLGHAEVTYTYWYLTATPELLGLAAARFESASKMKEALP